MNNLLQQAIDCDDADRAATIIRDALNIESDDVVKYLPFRRPGRLTVSGAPVNIGEWLKTEARYLGS